MNVPQPARPVPDHPTPAESETRSLIQQTVDDTKNVRRYRDE
jgi:hypothetical protein